MIPLRMASHLLRAFRKHKLYVAITVIGLSLSLGACLLILSFVHYECSFENGHEHAHRIYRIGGTWTDDDVTYFLSATMYPLGPTLDEALPEVEHQVRLRRFDDVLVTVDHDQTCSAPKFLLADPEVFSVFTIPLIQGDPGSALASPQSVVISERIRQRLFAGTDPIGETITIRDSIMLTVTGVMSNMPLNTQIQTDFLASFTTLEQMGEDLYEWNNTRSFDAYTYLLLADGASPAEVEAKIPAALATPLGEDAPKCALHLQPLYDLHFHAPAGDDIGPTGSLTSVALFAAIGLLLLLMACFNYINLATARTAYRFREVMVRSALGANRRQLLSQFLSESVLLVSVATVLGLAFYEMLVPYLEAYLGKSLGIGLSSYPFVWLAAPALAVLVGVLAGIYPAVTLARLKSRGFISGNPITGSQKTKLRRTLVIVQATTAIVLVGFTTGVQRQLDYADTMDHGFDPNNVWLVEFAPEATQDQKVRLRQALADIGLSSATLTSHAPGESAICLTVVYDSVHSESGTKYINTFLADTAFGATFDLKLKSGRWLSDRVVAGTPGAILINEAAAVTLGLDDPIGTQLTSNRGTLTIVGVVKDFHSLSLHNKIFPSMITVDPTAAQCLAVRLPEHDRTVSMSELQRLWTSVFPDADFKCARLSDTMSDSYAGEQKLLALFSIASSLSVLISCLGLLGLASFMIERRTKEIGVRKTLGATGFSVVHLLIREFVLLIIVAGVIAWPLTDYALTRWLDNFAYTVDHGWSIFASSVAIVLLLSLLAIGAQITRAARTNPVDALRCE